MRKLVLLPVLWCLLTSIAIDAQNYRAYIPQRPAYFHSNSNTNYWYYDETRGIAEDSVWYAGSHRIVQSYNEEISSGNQWSSCFHFDTTWVGIAIEQDTVTGETWFFNYEGDTIRFDPAAGIGQSGFICRMVNGDVMRGIVTSVIQGNVMAGTDSIRIITLNLEDQFGSPLASIFNGKAIMLGKQYGLVRTYKWADFPMDTASYTLYGMENPVEGGRIVTAQQIFDYNIGDRFDWYTGTNPNAMQFPTEYYYYSRVITGKTVNGDTVTYNYTEDVVHKMGSTVLSQQWGISGSVTIEFSVQDAMYEFANRPYDMLQNPDTTNLAGSNFAYATMEYAPGICNGRQLKGYVFGPPYFYDSASHCFNGLTVSWGPCDGYHTVWGEGIGEVYSNGGSATCYGFYYLVYFEKGTETWGTPHNWSVILGEHELIPQTQTLNCYPNPAGEEISFVLPSDCNGPVTYAVYSVAGDMIRQGSVPAPGNKVVIGVADFASGSYLVEIVAGNKLFRSKFVK